MRSEHKFVSRSHPQVRKDTECSSERLETGKNVVREKLKTVDGLMEIENTYVYM